jgi:hypothetical protein
MFCFNVDVPVQLTPEPSSPATKRRKTAAGGRGGGRGKAKAKSKGNFPFALGGAREAAPAPLTCKNPPTTVDMWMERLVVTAEEVAVIANYTQGTEDWLNSRKGRITGSNFGAAIGVNKYMSRRGLIKQMLWTTFRGNMATRWGSEHEDIARDAFLEEERGQFEHSSADTVPEEEKDTTIISIEVEETGLVINPERSWMGNSPDGIITRTYASGRIDRGLLEIKCPFKKTFYDPPVPVYSTAQIQGTMGNLGLPWCDFVVWTPTGMQITRVPFDTEFWDTTLLPGLTDFYFNHYRAAGINKENGLLHEGEIVVEDPPLVLG